MNHIPRHQMALVIIDVQNDYFEGGLYPLEGTKEALDKCKQLLTHFRDRAMPVIHVRHISKHQGAKFFLPDSEGSQINEDLEPLAHEPVVIKHRPDAFYETNLEALLVCSGVSHLLVCGMMSHHCVDTTVRVASNRYEVVLAHDACATRALTYGGRVLEAHLVHEVFMASLQGFSQVLGTDDILKSI